MRKRCVEIIALVLITGTVYGQSEKLSEKAVEEISALIEQGKISEAIQRSETAPDSAPTALLALISKSDNLITLRKIDEAKRILAAVLKFTEAFQLSEENGHLSQHALEGRQLRLQGIELNDAKEFQEAEPVLRKALEMSQKAGDEVLEAGIRNNLGYSLRNQSKLDAAVQEFDTARRLAETQNDTLRAGSYNFNLGNALLALGRKEDAYEAFKRSAEQNRDAERKDLIARSTLMMGVALSQIDSISEEPLKYFGEAQKMFEDLGDDRNCGWSFYLMADHIAYSFKFAEAMELGEKAIPYLKKAEDTAGLIRCYTLLSDMYGRLQQTEKATEYRQLARKLSIQN